MSDESNKTEPQQLTVPSSRFGEFTVAADSVIEFPTGLIGFPRTTRFVMLEHKPPFSWLHSIDDPNLAFVVVDGAEFGKQYQLEPPVGDKTCDLKPDDEYAILVIVTVRPDPHMTTANLKAPLFVNIRNKKGVQVIFDNPKFSTRFPLWQADQEAAAKADAEVKPEPQPGSEEADKKK